MLFGELVRDGGLGIQVVVAADGASERRVRAAVITDLPDPSLVLEPDAVLLTTAMWSFVPGGTERFLTAVVASRAAALVIGLGAVGVVPDEVVELCRRAGLTLATMSADLSFAPLAARIAEAQPDSVSATLRRGEALRHRLADAAGSAEALAVLVDEAGLDGWVMTTTGDLAAWAGERPSDTARGDAWNATRVGHEAPAGIHAIRRGRAHTLGHLVVSGQPGDGILHPLLARLALDLSRDADREQTRRDAAVDLLSAIRSSGASSGEVSARLRLLGLDPTKGLVVVAGAVGDSEFAPAATLRILRSALERGGARTAGTVADDAALVFASNTPPAGVLLDFEDSLPLLDGRRLRVGVSEPVEAVSQLGTAVATAQTRMRGVTGDGPVAVSDRSDALTHRELLAQFAEPVRSEYAHRVLDPLAEYDSKNGGDLLSTLRLFLDNNGAWVETARMLDLHPNTMRYRMGRVEDLTNRDLTKIADRVDLFLALVCLDL